MYLSIRKTSLGLILTTAAIAIMSLSAYASDPLAGTWELNVEKSTFSPGPPPKSEIRTYEVTGQQEKMGVKRIDAKGDETSFGFTANRGGKDYPYEGSPTIDTISLTSVDTFTATYVLKKAGEVVLTGTRAISKDGKTMTLPIKFTTPKGVQVDNLMIFDKR